VYCDGRICPECGHYIQPRGKLVRTIEGDLVEVGTHLANDEAAQLAFYLELKGHGLKRGFKAGFAAHKYKELHGRFPPWSWNDQPAAQPSLETQRWIQSRNIAYARRTGETA
jgi:hypothetical protein